LFILLGWAKTKECRKLFYLFHGKFYAKNMVKMIQVGVIIYVFAHKVLLFSLGSHERKTGNRNWRKVSLSLLISNT
jgi:hypothetical protein